MKDAVGAYSEILESAIDAIFTVDLDGTVLSWNTSAAKLYGYTSQEAIGKNASFIVPEHRRSEAEQLRGLCLRGEPVSNIETERITKHGSKVFVSASLSPIVRAGTVIGISSISRNVSTQVKKEEIMRARLRLLEFAVDHSSREVLQAALEQAERLTGSTVGFLHFVSPDERTLSLQVWSTNTRKDCEATVTSTHYPISTAGVWADCIRARRPVIHNDYEALPHRKGTPDGHVALVREACVPVFRSSKIVAIVGVGNKATPYDDWDMEILELIADLSWDVAERKRWEEALHDSEKKFTAVFRVCPDPIIIFDAEHRISEANQAALSFLERSRDEVIGRTASELRLSSESERLLEEFRNTGAIRDREVSYTTVDGTERYAEISMESVNIAESPCTVLVGHDVTDRKFAEKTLRVSEHQYKLLFRNNPLPMWVYDCKTLKFVDVNEAAIRKYGYSREEFLELTLCDIRPPDDVPALLNRLTELPDGINSTEVWRHKTKDERVLKVEVTGFYFNLGGAKQGLVLANDVTERDRIHEQLKNSQAQLERIIGSALDGIITVDSDGCVVLFNKAAELIFRCTASDATGSSIERFIPPRFRSRHQRGFKSVFGGGQPARFGVLTGLKADGEEFPIEASISGIEVGGKQLHTIILRDITERRIAEQRQLELQVALIRSAAEWTATFDAVQRPILLVDATRRVKRLNKAAKELLGAWRYQDIVGCSVLNFPDCEPWKSIAQLTAEALRTGETAAANVTDESNRTWDVAATPVRSEDTPLNIVVYLREISDLVSLQESLRRSETMAAMGSLVAGVAHEVRNPLFSISATIDTFEACFGDRDEFGEYISILRGEIERLRRLMEELLEFGKPPSSRLEEGLLEDVIVGAMRLCTNLADAREINLVSNISESLPSIAMISSRLTLLLKNLIENAVQHAPVGTSVAIEASCESQDKIVCAVSDCGRGFNPDDLPRIFEPFFTRRRGGTGLGLSIAQRIAEEHGGTLAAFNNARGGATVTLTLHTNAQSRGQNAGA